MEDQTEAEFRNTETRNTQSRVEPRTPPNQNVSRRQELTGTEATGRTMSHSRTGQGRSHGIPVPLILTLKELYRSLLEKIVEIEKEQREVIVYLNSQMVNSITGEEICDVRLPVKEKTASLLEKTGTIAKKLREVFDYLNSLMATIASYPEGGQKDRLVQFLTPMKEKFGSSWDKVKEIEKELLEVINYLDSLMRPTTDAEMTTEETSSVVDTELRLGTRPQDIPDIADQPVRDQQFDIINLETITVTEVDIYVLPEAIISISHLIVSSSQARRAGQ